MQSTPSIIVTAQDLERLQQLLGDTDSAHAERLDIELARADVVPAEAVPTDVVTMNSEVVFEDLTSGERRCVRLVYPAEVDSTRGFISVLAPMGSALLGLRCGQEITWPTPRGLRTVRVIEVPYQPEQGDRSRAEQALAVR